MENNKKELQKNAKSLLESIKNSLPESNLVVIGLEEIIDENFDEHGKGFNRDKEFDIIEALNVAYNTGLDDGQGCTEEATEKMRNEVNNRNTVMQMISGAIKLCLLRIDESKENIRKNEVAATNIRILQKYVGKLPDDHDLFERLPDCDPGSLEVRIYNFGFELKETPKEFISYVTDCYHSLERK